jgi:hypothetical protein
LEYAIVPTLGVILLAISAVVLFVSEDWRLNIIMLGMLYLGVFLLVSLSWPAALSLTKLLAGWIAGAVLVLAYYATPELRQEAGKPVSASSAAGSSWAGRSFYLMAAVLVGLVVVSQANYIMEWLPDLSLEQAWGGLLLIGIGLLKLGFTSRPLPGTLGLLAALAGFEILYATVETSTLIAGLFAGITLGLSLCGAYLLVVPYMEES